MERAGSSILLAVPAQDTFARVLDFHFSRAGLATEIVDVPARCLERVRAGAAGLAIVDLSLPGADRLLEDLKLDRAASRTPAIGLFPGDRDPARSQDLLVLPDEHVVEPFEVRTLLDLAERLLAARAREDGATAHRVRFQLGTTRENIHRAIELGERLCAASGLDEEGRDVLEAAYREALANAAQHGSRDDPAKLIRVEWRGGAEEAAFLVADEGPGFDHPAEVARARSRDALTAARERHAQGLRGGLGVMLMLKCADRVEWNARGNEVTLAKAIAAAPARVSARE